MALLCRPARALLGNLSSSASSRLERAVVGSLASRGLSHATATRASHGIVASYAVPSHRATRVDNALQSLDPERFPSASRAKRECRDRFVLVNGKVVKDPSTLVSAGDEISLQRRLKGGDVLKRVAPFALDVLYEDNALAVVYKPEGIYTHPHPGAPCAEHARSMATAVKWLPPAVSGTVGAPCTQVILTLKLSTALCVTPSALPRLPGGGAVSAAAGASSR